MLRTSAIFLCLQVLPHVLGYPPSLEDLQWPHVPGDKDPSVIKRHIYDFSEWCPIESRVMKFGDELIVETQRPWSPIYKTNVSCTMTLTTSPPDLGIIVNLLVVDTVDCKDYFRLTSSISVSGLLCGPDRNVTGRTIDFMHETIQLDWQAAARVHDGKRAAGVRILFTAFQKKCKPDQACFRCANGRIIDREHMCNRRDNCGDNSDERNCRYHDPKQEFASFLALSVLILVAAWLLLMLADFALSIFKFLKGKLMR